MFYCEECRVKREWPPSITRSHGPCECCGKTRVCHDRPSMSLPERTRYHTRKKATRKKKPASVAKRQAAQKKQRALEDAVRRSTQALNDWLIQYAPEQHSQKMVLAARKRVFEGGGTLAYVADVLRENREALGEE